MQKTESKTRELCIHLLPRQEPIFSVVIFRPSLVKENSWAHDLFLLVCVDAGNVTHWTHENRDHSGIAHEHRQARPGFCT